MRIDKIYLNGFRNYENAFAEFSPEINVITGQNAQGKTNLLEAIYILTGGKSFRTRFDGEIIGFDYSGAEILANIYAQGRDQTVRVLLNRGQRKTITRNGVKTAASELTNLLRAVLFCPDDLDLIKTGASARRRLLDMSISQLRPGYAALISEYNRLHDHKMSILKEYDRRPDLLKTLDDFSQAMCATSAKLIRYRAAFTQKLAVKAQKIAMEFSGGGETLDISYKTVSAVTDPLAPTHTVLEQLYAHMFALRNAELSARACLSGAHKDDLDIRINGVPARSYASQGQARTAALSIKLGEREIFLEETGEYPVLLLDDVLSELDQRRQSFVLNRIGGGQTLITCCEDEGIVQKTGGRVLTVKSGEII